MHSFPPPCVCSCDLCVCVVKEVTSKLKIAKLYFFFFATKGDFALETSQFYRVLTMMFLSHFE